MRASVVTGSYGLSSFLPVDKNHDQLSPACAIAGRLVLVAPVHPPSSRTANAAGRCRSSRTCLSLSIESEEVPFGANFLGCFAHALPAQGSIARSTVDFPRRCPFSGIRQCSLPRGGVRRYKPILQIALPRFCPEAAFAALRYQTAGSIGALARDEPVTPGVTFLSPPAPNSGDVEDR